MLVRNKSVPYVYLAKSSRNEMSLSCHWCVREKVRVRDCANTIVRVFRSLAIGARKDRLNVCALLPLVRERRTTKQKGDWKHNSKGLSF